jgi:hypothetical protein
MTDQPSGGITESIQKWARAVLLPVAASVWTVIGAFWGYYTWYYKEIWLPSTAPINVTTNVTVKEAGFKGGAESDTKGELEAIEVAVTATNPGTRPVYFLSNYMSVLGKRVNTRDADEAWIAAVNGASANRQQVYNDRGRHYEKVTTRVGWANIFPASYLLHPNESVSNTTLFYVPKGLYDTVEVDVHLPSTSVPHSVEYVYKLDNEYVYTTAYRIGPNKARTEMRKHGGGSYADPAIGLQETKSWRELSLWSSPPPATKELTVSSP